jgi:hypothetical protein
MYPAPPVTRTVMMLARLRRRYRAAGKFQVSGTLCYGPEGKCCAARMVPPGAPRIVKM